MTSKKYFKALVVTVCMVATLSIHAQTDVQSSGPSYKERRDPRLSKSGPLDADPNVYVYTAEFAKRFQMPDEWVSNELKGVDAVAFRVIPRPYKSCGWGRDPNACSSNEVLCEMDLYFDHKRNPLPWDERFPEIWVSRYAYSVNFIPAPVRELRLPKRASDHYLARYSPFVDPNSGKGLWWQGGYWNSNEDRGGIYMSVTSYDREIFTSVSLVVMAGGCGQPADAVWLTGDNAGYREKNTAFKQISLPQSWRVRAQGATKESSERAAAFFKQEGEKAMKALRESPVPNKSIVPVQ